VEGRCDVGYQRHPHRTPLTGLPLSAPKARLRIFLGIVPAVLPLNGLRSLVWLIGIYAVLGVMLMVFAFRPGARDERTEKKQQANLKIADDPGERQRIRCGLTGEGFERDHQRELGSLGWRMEHTMAERHIRG
jgi:hypothetical protein